ncbi:hypothetical protein [Georgenia yuyongxinii]|uniref:Uncharacterized protein n=1 Tax=Georgenia yuyongxinii TaxID=2589797 RepID=A0A552WUF4_9MICO|nr:hypothetical protein [Georgenia yuyongxinii]TRW46404.1 hypothetical protein FJ693_05610 [Georgenia yuyongxinii]
MTTERTTTATVVDLAAELDRLHAEHEAALRAEHAAFRGIVTGTGTWADHQTAQNRIADVEARIARAHRQLRDLTPWTRGRVGGGRTHRPAHRLAS